MSRSFDEYKVNDYVLTKISDELDYSGKISSAVFENMMRNNNIKADVIR